MSSKPLRVTLLLADDCRLSPLVMGVGQERRLLLVALSVCERGHLPSTNMVIVKTSRRKLVEHPRLSWPSPLVEKPRLLGGLNSNTALTE